MTDEIVFGLDISRIEADRLADEFIRPEWLDIERILLTGKWFEYRFLSPTAATYLFAHEFTKAYRYAFQRNIDTERGQYVKPLPDDLFKAKQVKINGIWRARQIADAMGMPYAVYLERAYHWGTRFWRQRYLPQPHQIFSDLITNHTAIDWDEYQRNRLYYSTLPQYRTQSYDERVVALNAHHEYLFAQIASRGNQPSLIARFIDEDLLPLAKIDSRLGHDVCQSALALSGRASLH